MLETKELEREIKARITNVMPNLELNQIRFCVGNDNSPEGTYIYMKNNKYYYVFTEKGKIREKKELETEGDVLWYVLEVVLFNVAMDYAIKNQESGKDFRRILFAKEIELYSEFGEDFRVRKAEEINKILEINPYVDR